VPKRRLHDRIAKDDQQAIVVLVDLFRDGNGVAKSEHFLLLNDVDREVPVGLADVLFDPRAQITNHKRDAVHSGGDQVVDDVVEDGLAGNLQQHLGLGVGVRPHATAKASDGDDCSHGLFFPAPYWRSSARRLKK